MENSPFRDDMLVIGLLILTLLFIIVAITLTIHIISTTENICREFPQLSGMLKTTSITLLLIMWLVIALLAIYVLALTFLCNDSPTESI